MLPVVYPYLTVIIKIADAIHKTNSLVLLRKCDTPRQWHLVLTI